MYKNDDEKVELIDFSVKIDTKNNSKYNRRIRRI